MTEQDVNTRIEMRKDVIMLAHQRVAEGDKTENIIRTLLLLIDDLFTALRDARHEQTKAQNEVLLLERKLEAAVNARYEQQARADNLEDGR